MLLSSPSPISGRVHFRPTTASKTSGFWLSSDDGSRSRITEGVEEALVAVPCAIGEQDSGAIGKPLGPVVADSRAIG